MLDLASCWHLETWGHSGIPVKGFKFDRRRLSNTKSNRMSSKWNIDRFMTIRSHCPFSVRNSRWNFLIWWGASNLGPILPLWSPYNNYGGREIHYKYSKPSQWTATSQSRNNRNVTWNGCSSICFMKHTILLDKINNKSLTYSFKFWLTSGNVAHIYTIYSLSITALI